MVNYKNEGISNARAIITDCENALGVALKTLKFKISKGDLSPTDLENFKKHALADIKNCTILLENYLKEND